MIQAALFDFDGVLFDTDALHEMAWRHVAISTNQTITREQFLQGFGLKNSQFIREILKWSQDEKEVRELSAAKEHVFQKYIKTCPASPIKGVSSLLRILSYHSIPCIIGTSSIKENVNIIFSHHRDLQDYFIGIVSGEDVVVGKPDPDVFIKGASIVQAAPEYTVVFEDAPLGVRAGKRAGMKVVALMTTFSRECLAAENPDLILSDFSELSYDLLQSLFLKKL